jgi:hypothetical protein
MQLTDEDLQAIESRLLARRRVCPNDGCWYWLGCVTGNGYGHISFLGRVEYTHRLAAVVNHGLDLESGLCVRHTCDHPACFNPDHLQVGTQKENMEDAAAKGRMGGYRLTPSAVASIKYQLDHGATYRTLATQHGVSTTAIGQIARGETWKDVQPAVEVSAAEQSNTGGQE